VQMAIAPQLKWIGRSAAAAFDRRPLIRATRRVFLPFIRRTMDDVDAAAVGAPSRNARGEMLVGVGDAAVVFFLELVFDGIGSGIAPQPELLDELLAFFIVLQAAESRPFFISDDQCNVLAGPLIVG